MSRIAKSPVTIPAGVEVKLKADVISIKGRKGELSQRINDSILVSIDTEKNIIEFSSKSVDSQKNALAGTTRALINNMVLGVSEGFTKKLVLKGVGYRASAKSDSLSLTLGFSHPVDHKIPAGVVVNCPSQTEIVLESADKQLLGQVAADVRAYRPPEPYKGKGISYSDEKVRTKEAKKK